MAKNRDSLSLRGFGRVQIVDRKTGKICSDTDYFHNEIQITGFEAMIVKNIITSAGSSVPRYLGLGNHTAAINSTNFTAFNTSVGTGGTGNKGLITGSPSVVSTADGGTLRLTATFIGTDHLGADGTINAIGMFNSTNQTNDMLCGTTYASSSWSSDQDVKATYELRFSQT